MSALGTALLRLIDAFKLLEVILVLTNGGPGLAVAAIFTFRIAWNEFLLANALADRNSRTVPVTIVNSLTKYNID